jgi:hypothetical protein
MILPCISQGVCHSILLKSWAPSWIGNTLLWRALWGRSVPTAALSASLPAFLVGSQSPSYEGDRCENWAPGCCTGSGASGGCQLRDESSPLAWLCGVLVIHCPSAPATSSLVAQVPPSQAFWGPQLPFLCPLPGPCLPFPLLVKPRPHGQSF